MLKKTYALFICVGMGLLLTVFILGSASVQRARAEVLHQQKPDYQPVSEQKLPEFLLIPSDPITYYIFLPSSLNIWSSPCGVIPHQVSPTNGSTVTSESDLVFEGGYSDDINDWLELEYNTSPDFTGDGSSRIYQPAGELWTEAISTLKLEPGIWYWRTSIWCNGPDWPPPPDNYDHSHFSETWSFTLK